MTRTPEIYRFGRFELRRAERCLLVDGVRSDVGSRALDLLVSLIERRDRVVPKSELMDLVWPNLVVEDNNLQVQISALRKLLGSHAIATVPGRGYRFAAELDGGSPERAVDPGSASRSGAQPGNCPAQMPALVGREDELRDLVDQVRRHRLVTLVGASGIGKTTLAVAAACDLCPEWPDGAWIVDLATLADPRDVPIAVAHALDVPLGSGTAAADRVFDVLRARSALVVLDNCEHVIDGVTSLATGLVAQAPGIHVLTTSQELLNVPEERVVKLRPLAVPAPDAGVREAMHAGAVRLFAERAAATDPRFVLDADAVQWVADICRQLDGLPLAIQLAAARVRVLGVKGVHDRLGERFRLLTGGARTALPRHQTLLSAIDWSHGLLSPQEQRVVRRLAVFVGSFSLPLAQAVVADSGTDAWDVLDALSGLVDKSIVAVQDGEEPRYRLLESTRAYCLDKLATAGETADLMRRHAEALQALFVDVYDARFGEQGTWSDAEYTSALTPDIDNFRAAFRWAQDHPAHSPDVVDMAAALAETAALLGRASEGVSALTACLPAVAAGASTGGALRFWTAVAITTRDRWPDDRQYARAIERAETGARAGGCARQLHRVLLAKAWRLMRELRFDEARDVIEEAARLERPDWPAWLCADRWNTLANVLYQMGRSDEAWHAHEAIERMLPLEGEERRRARLAMNKAAVHGLLQQWSASLALLQPLLLPGCIVRRHPELHGWSLAHVVLALTELDRLDEAAAYLEVAIPLWRADGVFHIMLFVAIRLVAASGRTADAVRLIGKDAATASAQWKHERMKSTMLAKVERMVEQAAPDPKQRERWKREGAQLGDEDAIALCLGDARKSRSATAGA